jgi:hypothetical protein
VYSRTPVLNDVIISSASDIIRKAGLDPMDFCIIRNACFTNGKKDCTPTSTEITNRQINRLNLGSLKLPSLSASGGDKSSPPKLSSVSSATSCGIESEENLNTEADPSKDAPFWYLGQRFFQVSNGIAKELADWFEDPAILSDWLVSQQEHGLLNKPLVGRRA